MAGMAGSYKTLARPRGVLGSVRGVLHLGVPAPVSLYGLVTAWNGSTAHDIRSEDARKELDL